MYKAEMSKFFFIPVLYASGQNLGFRNYLYMYNFYDITLNIVFAKEC
jgi:hypothetical protein